MKSILRDSEYLDDLVGKVQSNPPDLLIVGAGPSGCVIAERSANELGLRSLLIDKRNHIAGNCFDRIDEHGVLIQVYGPHYFRSKKKEIIDYLSKFTDWIPGDYIVQSQINGSLFPFPINLSTLEQFFGKALTEESAKDFLRLKQLNIATPKNSEEFVLSKVGPELYRAFYQGYSTKQWGCPPSQLDPSVCGRVPVRLNRDNRYVDDPYQIMPKEGFTKLFQKMIDSPLIQCELGVDFKKLRNRIRAKHATIYCGPLDEYFNNKLGRLPWRSLRFDFQHYDKAFHQNCVQINYPGPEPFTRTVEFKHVTKQDVSGTTVMTEYPCEVGDPYYPVPSERSRNLFKAYENLASLENQKNNVFFVGRLAKYRYINTDEAIHQALNCYAELKTFIINRGRSRRTA